jgi:hypothetical protein
VPIQVTFDISLPGGHWVNEPPQQEQRKPSIAQFRQYSQVIVGSGAGAAACALERSKGNTGKAVAPTKTCPNRVKRERRPWNCAVVRTRFSQAESIQSCSRFKVYSLGAWQCHRPSCVVGSCSFVLFATHL